MYISEEAIAYLSFAVLAAVVAAFWIGRWIARIELGASPMDEEETDPNYHYPG